MQPGLSRVVRTMWSMWSIMARRSARMRPHRAYCNRYLLVPEEVEPEVSLPLEPLMPPELVPPLAAPEPVLSEEELDEGVDVPPAELEPYCFTQSSRSVPVMPTHWL